jgi:uncharacterized protein
MALSIYLMQSLICTWFFAGFGMGYFGRLTQVELYIVAAEISLLLVAFSMLWLNRFEYGPAEWLLRWLVYRKKLPNRIRGPQPADPAIPSQS